MDRIRIYLYKYSFFNICIYLFFILILIRVGFYLFIIENKFDVFIKFSRRYKFVLFDNLLIKIEYRFYL